MFQRRCLSLRTQRSGNIIMFVHSTDRKYRRCINKNITTVLQQTVILQLQLVREFSSKMIMAFHYRHGNEDICSHIIYTYWYFFVITFPANFKSAIPYSSYWFGVKTLGSGAEIWRWKEESMWQSDWGQQHCRVVISIFIHCPSVDVRLNGPFSFSLINLWPRRISSLCKHVDLGLPFSDTLRLGITYSDEQIQGSTFV